MIIPIKCFTCGFVIADKYRYYKMEVREKKLKNPEDNIKSVLYLTKEFIHVSCQNWKRLVNRDYTLIE